MKIAHPKQAANSPPPTLSLPTLRQYYVPNLPKRAQPRFSGKHLAMLTNVLYIYTT